MAGNVDAVKDTSMYFRQNMYKVGQVANAVINGSSPGGQSFNLNH